LNLFLPLNPSYILCSHSCSISFYSSYFAFTGNSFGTTSVTYTYFLALISYYKVSFDSYFDSKLLFSEILLRFSSACSGDSITLTIGIFRSYSFLFEVGLWTGCEPREEYNLFILFLCLFCSINLEYLPPKILRFALLRSWYLHSYF